MKAFFAFSDKLYPAFYPLNNDIVVNLTHPVMSLIFRYTPDEKKDEVIRYLGDMIEKEKNEPDQQKRSELERERYFMSTQVMFVDGNLKKFLDDDKRYLNVEVKIETKKDT